MQTSGLQKLWSDVTADTDLMRRLGFTLAALAIYRLAAAIPLPGLEPKALSHLAGAAPDVTTRISIVALGIGPLLTVLILAELIKVLAPRLRRWERADPANHQKLNRILVALAVAAAAAQALGLSVALEDVGGLVAEPGATFRLTCIVTLIAGAALAIWLADQITRHGLGAGVWVIFLTPVLADMPHRIAELLSWQGYGLVTGTQLLLGCGFTIFALAAIVALIGAGENKLASAAACLWPTLLAITILPWLLLALGALWGGAPSQTVHWMLPGHPVYFLAAAALIALFVHLYARSQDMAGGAAVPAIPAAVTGLMLITALLLGDFLPSALGLRVLVTAQTAIIIAVVALSIMPRLRRRLSPQD